jgi:hypothetical protein
MPCVGFKPTIPASERANTVHALDCSATVTGNYNISCCFMWLCQMFSRCKTMGRKLALNLLVVTGIQTTDVRTWLPSENNRTATVRSCLCAEGTDSRNEYCICGFKRNQLVKSCFIYLFSYLSLFQSFLFLLLTKRKTLKNSWNVY